MRAVAVFESSTSPLVEQMREAVAADAEATGATERDVYFGLWLLQADSILRARTGLTIFHLDGSWPWRRAYDDGEHPGIAAQRALRAHPKWSLFDLGDLEESPTLPDFDDEP